MELSMDKRHFGISNRSFDYIQEFLHSQKKIEEVVIYGSRAMGNHKKASDIDLAIKGENLTYKEISHIHFVLNKELPIPYFVDVLHYEDLDNEELKKHIDNEGKVFFSASLMRETTNN